MRRTAAVAVLVAGCTFAALAPRGGLARPTVVLRVVICPTTYGLTYSKAERTQTTRSLPVPVRSAIAPRLTVYAVRWRAFSAVLAPSGWHCSGGVGADGNIGVYALPPHVSQVTGRAPAVTAYWYANGVAASTACPFFPNTFTGICPKVPARERVTRLDPHSVGFEDPPGVKGSGWPSGGSLRARGVLTARRGTTKSPYETNVETCTLPESEGALCTAALNDFLERYHR